MFTYDEPSFERVRRVRLLRLRYLNDDRCTEDAFASALGVEICVLRKIESGREETDFAKASEVLHVSVDHLMSGRIMAEDKFAEPFVFRPHIGSVMHAARMQLRNESGKGERKEYSLKSVAQKLGVSSMELKRIEELNKSKNVVYSVRNARSARTRVHVNERFLRRVSEVLGLELSYIRSLATSSFPLGQEKKAIASKDHQTVRFIEEDNQIKGLVVLTGALTKNDLYDLKQRIEIEVDILRSKSHPK